MPVKAKLRFLRMSPKKIRLVADVVKGLDVDSAQKQLEFLNKRAAKPVLKLLNSAIANAENNFKLKKDNLYISSLRVDDGPILYRWMPRAFGRATPLRKRASHITIVLDERVKREEKKLKKAEEKKMEKVKETEKLDKDVRVVKSLDEIKEMETKEAVEEGTKEPVVEEFKKEPFDIRRESADREKQHLDKVRKKEKGGFLKRVFRRKSG